MTKFSTLVFAALVALSAAETANAQVKIGYTNIELVMMNDDDGQEDETRKKSSFKDLNFTKKTDTASAGSTENREFNIGMPPTLKEKNAASGKPQANREFNIGMPPSVAADSFSFGVEREMKESGEK